MIIFIFIFALLGTQFFYNPNIPTDEHVQNWNNIGDALLNTFQIMTM